MRKSTPGLFFFLILIGALLTSGCDASSQQTQDEAKSEATEWIDRSNSTPYAESSSEATTEEEDNESVDETYLVETEATEQDSSLPTYQRYAAPKVYRAIEAPSPIEYRVFPAPRIVYQVAPPIRVSPEQLRPMVAEPRAYSAPESPRENALPYGNQRSSASTSQEYNYAAPNYSYPNYSTPRVETPNPRYRPSAPPTSSITDVYTAPRVSVPQVSVPRVSVPPVDYGYVPPAITPGYIAPSSSDVYVSPYVKKDGTFVQGHMRSAPNGTKSDNFSNRGNINPYTGKRGTKR